ncbi:hypothetical protein E5Q_02029 [Mixia osmundae IAM 14324]|uniref:Peroxisomal-coenzyme A synthetase n=1 Tax=Mixia osmundae (strain CBS 9802 / IAM 14324 / JCM 22182 / KY 12970) TaxID=764103 RepID=G7DXR5_MIXOS|nr:hypothetical protein E5Q_02029 [Mixia osmundae IAM 14324]
MTTFASLVRHDDRPAIVLPRSATGVNARTVSHHELAELITSFQSQLSGAGTQPGDVISMSLINSLDFVIAFLAVGLNRSIAAPLNPAYKTSEVDFYLQDTKSRLLIVPAGAIQANTEAVQAARALATKVLEVSVDLRRQPLRVALTSDGKPVPSASAAAVPKDDDVALILHTSGTTGRPKAVPLTHRNLLTTMSNIKRTYALTEADRSYLVMPLFHVHGLLAGFLAPIYAGASAVVPPKFSAATFWPELIESKCTYYTAVPTIHQILLKTKLPDNLPKLRFIRSCSSALSPTTFHAIEETFGAPVLEAYAMTEAAHQMTSNPLPPGKRQPGSVGVGQGVAIRTLNDHGMDVPEGEVCIKGLNVTTGYINNEKANKESFTADGFFRTGDRGRLDSEGYLFLTGRIKELINRGGEKLSPLEIDAALLAVDGVAEAVAFGVPDEKYGETVWAALVLKDGSKLDAKSIQTAAAGKISKFKVPERIFLVDAIPKAATGKISRLNVSKTFQAKVAAQGRQSKL